MLDSVAGALVEISEMLFYIRGKYQDVIKVYKDTFIFTKDAILYSLKGRSSVRETHWHVQTFISQRCCGRGLLNVLLVHWDLVIDA